MKKVITCTGYHGTGSSVVSDLLKEFLNIKSFGEYEFRFLQDPNGVGDLEERLLNNNCRLNSDRAIYEFKNFIYNLNKEKGFKFWKKSEYEIFFNGQFQILTDKYINDLIDMSWDGMWHDIYRRKEGKKYKIFLLFQIILKKLKIIKNIKSPVIKMYYSYPYGQFKLKTQKYINNLLCATNAKEENLVFDQIVPVCNLKKYTDYFEKIKVVIVDRDPRDLYILNKVYWRDGVVPVKNVEEFIKHFLLIRKHKKNEKNEKNIVLEMRYEDFIYNYDLTLNKLLSFLEISPNDHKEKTKYFDPNISKNNTQLFNLYPQYEEDIKKINKELKEYCYEYPYLIEHQKNIF